MANPSVRGTSTITNAASASLNVDASAAGAQVGDLIIILASVNGANVGASTGFTDEGNTNIASDSTLTVLKRVRQGGDASTYTVTQPGGAQRFTVHLIAIQDADPAFDVAPVFITLASSTINATNITTLAANALVLLAANADGAGRTFSHNGTGYTTQQNSGDQGCMAVTKSFASPGAIGTVTFASSASDNLISVAMAFKAVTSADTQIAVGAGALALSGAAPTVVITSPPLDILTVPPLLAEGMTGVVITGSKFGATQGASQVLIDGTAQTVTNWADTAITFDVVKPNGGWASPRRIAVRRVY